MALPTDRTCEDCGDAIKPPSRFCSLICFGKARRKRVTHACTVCGERFELKASAAARGEGLFCSTTCYRTSLRGPRSPLADRFWSKVDKNGPVPAHRQEIGACWLWVGTIQHRSGYGLIGVEGKNELAHRIAYRLEHGAVPPKQHVLHACDNPPCVRPDHLFIGTQADNNRDAWQKGRAKPPRQPRPTQRARGERNGAAKLSDAQRTDILRLHAEGWTQNMLADEFRVHQTTISRVIIGGSRIDSP